MRLKIAFSILALIALFSLTGPLVSGYRYDEGILALKNSPPSWKFWFGSDDLGRDIFTRCCHGIRISLFVGIAAAAVDLAVGVLWGGAAALSSTKIDEAMMRLADALYSLPYLLVTILLTLFIGPGLGSIILALSFIGWITMARIARAQLLSLKSEEFVLAARCLGAGRLRILFLHLLPNASRPLIATLTLTVPQAIFGEAFLSFVGLGLQAPTASLGTMAADGLPALAYYPWRLLFPILLISVAMLAFNLMADSLQEEPSHA